MTISQDVAADPWQIVADLQQRIAASHAERAALELALRESEERYSLAMRAINEGFYEWDVATSEMRYSPRVCELVGLAPEELRTMADWTDRIHPTDMPEFRKAILAHFNGKTEWLEAEYRYRHADGTLHWARQHGIGLRNDAGRVYRVVGSTGDITAQKAAEEALRESLEQQTATAEILQVINSSPGDLAPVFGAILDKAYALCGAGGDFLTFDGEFFRSVATRGMTDRFTRTITKQPYRLHPDNPANVLVRSEQPFVHVADLAEVTALLAADPMARAAFEEGGVRTVLMVPLRKDNNLLGIIVAQRREVRPFTDKQIALLQNFAAQAVIAMENARLLTETREALEQQTATAEVLQVINSSPGNLPPVFDAIVEKAHTLCGAVCGSLQLWDGEKFGGIAMRGFPEPMVESLRQGYTPGPNHPCRELIDGGRIAHCADMAAVDDPITQLGAKFSGVRTVAYVALRKDGALLGQIVACRLEVRPFTEAELALLENFAAQAVIAMENARLLTETREALEQQTATAEVLQVINSSPGDLAPVFDAILEKAHTLCGAAHGGLNIYDGERFRNVAAHAMPPQFVELMRQPFHARRIQQRLLRGERYVHVSDVMARAPEDRDDPIGRASDEAGIRTLLVVPLRKDGTLLGYITAHREEVRPFTDKQIALLQNFAAQAVIAMENARLLTETREALEQQTATAEVLQVINSSPGDLTPVFDAILEKAHTLCGAAHGVMVIREAEGFRTVAANGEPAFVEAMQQFGPMRPPEGSGAARLIRGEPIVHIADFQAESFLENAPPQLRRASEIGKIRTVAMVPLRKDDAVVGFITAFRQEVRPFSDKQIALLQNFAAQAVIAMENARLLTETREALEQQTATAEVLQVINSSPGDLAPVFEAMLEKAVNLCDASFGLLMKYNGEALRAVAHYNSPPAFVEVLHEPVRPAPGMASYRILRGEDVVAFADVAADPTYGAASGVARRLVETSGARSHVTVALRKDGNLLGQIVIYHREVRPFSEKQIALLQNFAAQAVIAMENARLLTETREALEQQTATAEVLQVINSSPGDLAPVFDAILEKALRLCDAGFGHFRTSDGERFPLVAVRGHQRFVDVMHQRAALVPGPHHPLARIIAGEDVNHIADAADSDAYRNDPRFRELVDTGVCRSLLGVALRKDKTLLGYLVVYRQEVRPFADKEVALLQNFAAQAVIAMENARLLDEIRQRQQELRVTFDNMADGVAMFDETLHLAAWNRNFQELLRLTDEFLAKRHDFNTYIRYLVERGEFGETDPETQIARLRARIGDHYSFERTRPDGTVIEVRHNPMPSGGIVLIYSDITERKRSEAEIKAARDTAEAAYRDLKAAQASLIQAEKMASLGQLTAGIAHEIKNPLNFVNNFAGLSVELLDELKETAAPAISALDDERRAEIDETIDLLSGNLDKIAEHGRRADNIVASMLEHSRGTSGERGSVDLNALVEEALNLAYHGGRAQAQSFNITLERDYADTIAPIELVPQDITRVCLNLFGNGFYAATKRQREASDGSFKPTLKVSTRDLGDAVEIRVRDNGTGIPPEIKDKLFQPFFTTKPTGEGTGLGLSISYDIVTQQHGGTITVGSRLGEFTEFTVRLPRAYRATTAEAAS